MRVLVTGASGLIGTEIVKYFLSRNFLVTGIVNKSSACISNSSYKEISIDLVGDSFELEERAYDLVVHCAAVIPNGIISEKELFDRNQRLDKVIISFCEENNIKLIFFSTVFLLDINNTSLIVKDSQLIANLNGYYLSKKTTENYLKASRVSTIIFRVSSPYGNLSKQNNVMKIFATRIKINASITLFGNGERRQNFIFVEDIAEACYLGHLKKIEGTFNLTANRSNSMLELASYIKELYKSESPFLFDNQLTEVEQDVVFDNKKLKEVLNWSPFYDLKTGLVRTLLSEDRSFF